ncbi:helix-turn-helix domain-containing protein [Endothiovibrio diazotrophicus]
MITGDQVRMGRAAVGWTVRELAKHASVAPNTVNRFEHGENTTLASVRKMQEAMEAAGVAFTTATETLEPGVALRKGREKP